MTLTVVRYACLAVPIILVLIGAAVERRKRARAAALLAFLAAMLGVAALNELARIAHWHSFAAVDGAFRGVPVDLWLGWALLWGAAPVLYRRWIPVPVALIGLLWVDIVAMPRLDPLVRLGPDWLLMLAPLVVVSGSNTLGMGAAVAVLFSLAVAGPHERHDLRSRHGATWLAYRESVHDWLPRWTPYRPGPPATIWLDERCDVCAAVGTRLTRLEPRGLMIAPAAQYRGSLIRARYEDGVVHGPAGSGVVAVARGLEHVHLGWAYVGWVLRSPGVAWLAQRCSDAMLAAPHLVSGSPDGPTGASCPVTPSNGCSTERSVPSRNTGSPASRRGRSRRRRA